jgi:recombination protein U
VEVFWNRAKNGGKKSFRREELDASFRIPFSNQIYIHYLETLSKDLEAREERG